MYKSIDDPARRQMEKRIEGISLGVFFFWIGFCWLFQFCMSVPLIGISLIIFSAQIVRILAGFKPQGFWLFLLSL